MWGSYVHPRLWWTESKCQMVKIFNLKFLFYSLSSMHCTKRLLRRWEGEILLRVPEILFRVPEILFRVPILFSVPEILIRVPGKNQAEPLRMNSFKRKLILLSINLIKWLKYISLVHTIFVLSDLLRHLVRSNNFEGCDYPIMPMWWWSTAKTKSIHYNY